ncbi:hypothetical protein ATU3B_23115 [Agrobacterium genomosp. 3 str. CIP 111-78]|uniref:Uncharacterized protein n=1 Tax=Agrobacterium tumefaciens TaxID=358 RepID=A0AAE6BMN4_AGRTU|nr:MULTISPECIES: hypothetical protein [Agrobacterium tumefaciens complex]MCA2374522.1 hypothetical protein [Agrobacterium tomkonis CIP 111-78]QCL99950.1 hypothetical protein CFBP6624_07255 [Agrobacterium tumefaciens]
MGTIDRNDYRAELGEFLLAFNATENLLNDIIAYLLERLNKKDRFGEDMFDRRLWTLELLIPSFEPIHVPDFDKLRELNRSRNELAHGHMRTDPNTGAVDIVKAKDCSWGKGQVITPDRIRRASTLAQACHKDLDAMTPHIWFAHTPPKVVW